MKRNLPVTALLGIVALVLALTACGSSTATMHGTLTVTTSSGSSSFCGGSSSNVQQGTQVAVIAPSGSVIGTGQLSAPKSSASTQLGCVVGTDIYKFTVTGLTGEPRYGVQLSGEQGTVWFNPNQLEHASFSLG